MAEPVVTPPAAPPASTPSEFQAAAMALIAEREKDTTPPASPTVPPAAVPPADPAAPTDAPAPPRGFDVLAQEKAKLRKREQEVNERLTKHQRVLDVLEKGGSALDILAAAGKSYKDAAMEVLQGKPTPTPASAGRAADDPLASKVDQLTSMLREEREQRARAELTAQAVKLATDGADKYRTTAALGKAPQAVEFLNQYYTSTGELPVPGDLQGSLVAAMDYVESQAAKEIQQQAALLQKLGYVVTKSGEVPKNAAQPPASVQGSQSKTLNNSQAAPSQTASLPEPKTPADFRALALKKFEEMAARS